MLDHRRVRTTNPILSEVVKIVKQPSSPSRFVTEMSSGPKASGIRQFVSRYPDDIYAVGAVSECTYRSSTVTGEPSRVVLVRESGRGSEEKPRMTRESGI